MPRINLRRALGAAAALVVLAALLSPFVLRRTLRYYTDGGALREEVRTARPALREILWQPASVLVRERAIHRPDTDEYEPRVSPDGRLLVFTRGRPGGSADLWIAERRATGWGEPTPLAAINSPFDDMGACFGLVERDGRPPRHAVDLTPPRAGRLLLVFYSDRPGGMGGHDIWASLQHEDGSWGEPRNLGAQVNTPFSELSPSVTPDSRLLFFATNRRTGRLPEPPRWTATVRETLDVAEYDVYAAARLDLAGVEFAEAEVVEALSFPGSSEGALALSPHGDFVYFASDRPGGLGGFDIYRARLAEGRIGPPENLGPQINTAGHELDPGVSSSGFELYFARRPEGRATEELFVSVSREVFLKSEAGETYWSFAAVVGFLRQVLARVHPAIIALVLSIFLCLIFAWLFGRRLSRLALLTRCFLIALLIHFLIALWMNTNRVQRILLAGLGTKDVAGKALVVSIESNSEEDVAFSIRSQVAATGGDGAPAIGAIAIAPGRLEAREPVETPRLLDPEKPAPAGVLALRSAAFAARPRAARPAPPPAPNGEGTAEALAEVARTPLQDASVEPSVPIGPRQAPRPEAPRVLERSVELVSRSEWTPPAEELDPVRVGLRLDVPPEPALGQHAWDRPARLEPARAEPDGARIDAAAYQDLAREGIPSPEALIADPRPGRGPESVRPPRAVELERHEGRIDARPSVSSTRVLSPAAGEVVETARMPVAAQMAPAQERAHPRPEPVAVEPAIASNADPGAPASLAAEPRAVLPEAGRRPGSGAVALEVQVNGEVAVPREPATRPTRAIDAPARTPWTQGLVDSGAAPPAALPETAPTRDAADPASGVPAGVPGSSLAPDSPRLAIPRTPAGEVRAALASEQVPEIPNAGAGRALALAERPAPLERQERSAAAASVRPEARAPGAAGRDGSASSPATPDRGPGTVVALLLPSREEAGFASQVGAPRGAGAEPRRTALTPAAITVEWTARGVARLPSADARGPAALEPARASPVSEAPWASAAPPLEVTKETADGGAGEPPRIPGAAPAASEPALLGLRAAPPSSSAAPPSARTPALAAEQKQILRDAEAAAGPLLVPRASAERPRPNPPGSAALSAATIQVPHPPEEEPAIRAASRAEVLAPALTTSERLPRPGRAPARGERGQLPIGMEAEAPRHAEALLAAAPSPRGTPASVPPPPPAMQTRLASVPGRFENPGPELESSRPLPGRVAEPETHLAGSSGGSATAASGRAEGEERPSLALERSRRTPEDAATAPVVGERAATASVAREGIRAPLIPARGPPRGLLGGREAAPLPVAPPPRTDPSPTLHSRGEQALAAALPGPEAARTGLAVERGAPIVSFADGAAAGAARGAAPRKADRSSERGGATPPQAVRGAPARTGTAASVDLAVDVRIPAREDRERAPRQVSGERAAEKSGRRPAEDPARPRVSLKGMMALPERVVPSLLESPFAASPGQTAVRDPSLDSRLAEAAAARPVPSTSRRELPRPEPEAPRAPVSTLEPRGPLKTVLPRSPLADGGARAVAAVETARDGKDVAEARRLEPPPPEVSAVVLLALAPPPERESLEEPPAPRWPETDPSRRFRTAPVTRQTLEQASLEPSALAPVATASSFVPRVYELRAQARRVDAVKKGGGGPETERAVERGLAWLANHQSPDGRWSLRDYYKHLDSVSDRDRWHPDWNGRGRHDSRGGTSRAENGDTAATGLALLAFLGHGDTHLEKGVYQEAVGRGLRFIVSRQQRDGDLRGGGNLYMHAIASFALCEAYALTRDPELAEPARRAIGYTLRTQNPDLGGWRYDPYPQGRDVDTSVFGWMLMAVKSARIGGIEVDQRAVDRMWKYLDSARMSRGGGRYAYQPGLPRSSLAMVAQGFFCQQVLAELRPPRDEDELGRIRRSSTESMRILLQNLPEAQDQDGANSYYWYYAALALFQEGDGVAWETWNSRLKKVLLKLQLDEDEDTAAGSWDPLDRRAQLGGRVYSTAISILCLEVYYRYAPKAK